MIIVAITGASGVIYGIPITTTISMIWPPQSIADHLKQMHWPLYRVPWKHCHP